MKLFGSKRRPKLYLICGGRRSGTTLLNAILCSDRHANPLGQEAQILTRLVESYAWGRQHFGQFGQSYFNNEEEYLRFYRDTVYRLTCLMAHNASPGNILVLKNPEFSLVLKDLLVLLPDATFMAMVRDPRDQACSELEVTTRRQAENGHTSGPQNRNIARLSRIYAKYNEQIVDTYRKSPDRLSVVRYEDLTLEPQKAIEMISKSTGLKPAFDPLSEWQDISPLAGLDSSPSQSLNYGRPINSSSIGRYKRELSAEEIADVESICSEIFDTFGYQ